MKKYSLLSVILIVLFSASTFANTGVPEANPGKDTSRSVKPALKVPGTIIVSFKGTINNNSTKLHWITEDEQGMKSFTIERSVNNRDFYPIAIMPAMNEKGQLLYGYPDTDISRLSSQVFFYRLKITDATDKENYSQVINLSADKNGAVAIR